MALYFARFTSLLAVVTLLATTSLLATKGLNFAVEFAGGMIIEVHYPEAVASMGRSHRMPRIRVGNCSDFIAHAAGKAFGANFIQYDEPCLTELLLGFVWGTPVAFGKTRAGIGTDEFSAAKQAI